MKYYYILYFNNAGKYVGKNTIHYDIMELKEPKTHHLKSKNTSIRLKAIYSTDDGYVKSMPDGQSMNMKRFLKTAKRIYKKDLFIMML